ncbi:MAG TPA: YihY/virulence factor BrkB family protein [Casimicrobiaceae bacterium]
MTRILDLLRPRRRSPKAQADLRNPPEPSPPPEPVYSLPARPPEPIKVVEPKKQPTGPLAVINKFAAKVTGNKYVARTLGVMNIANNAGATLFASALAYSTMFALIPIVLLLAGVLGWLIGDPIQRQQLLNQLIGYFPPFAEFFNAALNGVVAARGALSIVGLVGLLWGASSFYGGLDEVMRRIFVGGGIRGELDRRLRGIITVAGLIAVVIGTVLLSSVWALVDSLVGDLAIWKYVVPLIALGVFILVVLAIYKLVPTAPPSLRAAFAPAVVAGVGIGLLTNLFGVLAPVLIGGLTGFGVIATAFGLLIWLNLSYQILLYGAAWARLRRDREKDKRSVVVLAG